MKKSVLTFALGLSAFASSPVFGTLVMQTQHGSGASDLDGLLANSDLLSGLIATKLPGDPGWHPANPATLNGSLDPNGLPAFTNDVGEGGLAGLLSDFPGEGEPTKMIQYDLAGPSDLGQINILTGNEGADGRVFSTTRILYSTNNGGTFLPLGGYVPSLGGNPEGYYQSDASGTVNTESRSTLVSLFDDGNVPLATGVTNLQFFFYAVDNTSGMMRDPFTGVNPYTGADDGLSAAFVSPLIWEIDALEYQIPGIPESASAVYPAILVLLSTLALRHRRRFLSR